MTYLTITTQDTTTYKERDRGNSCTIKICKENKIQHRTIRFKHPWTNGMVEAFNKKIKNKVLIKYLFSSIFEMNGKLIEFVNDYNHNIRLRSLGYKTIILPKNWTIQ